MARWIGHRQDLFFGELDSRVNAVEMLTGHWQWHEHLTRAQSDLGTVRRDVDDHSDQLKGMSIILENHQTKEVKKANNTTSGVEHQAVILLPASPHTWKTKCGWKFAGKLNAETFAENATLIHTYRTCPTCHLLPESDEDSSSSSNDTDD